MHFGFRLFRLSVGVREWGLGLAKYTPNQAKPVWAVCIRTGGHQIELRFARGD